MRPSLVITGLFTIGLGLLLYLLELPFVYLWSFPFMVGGVAFMVVGAVVKESSGHVEPPAGYNFCVFCHTPVLVGAKRCDHCSGLQPE